MLFWPAAALQEENSQRSNVAQKGHWKHQQVGERVRTVLEGIIVVETRRQQLPGHSDVVADVRSGEQAFCKKKHTHTVLTTNNEMTSDMNTQSNIL